ncbi:hypothetical protein [Zestomonas carbonaria]|uniref:PilZ domain-containing protein n=1 Tax=Zestomonas carbonaria TaxID=2762745 RepID=A0A7U7ENV0_9GAMM|nr:hypothetical protein [Pseudomonas carbonaria]CAD5107495.1 hypothetical protein PSEWESI4_01768 [Pseudomonas carbonaria]
MQDDSILTQEELDFIRSLHEAPRPISHIPQKLTVEGGEQTRELLAQLATHEQLTIEAHIDSQRITFPVRVVEDEFNALHLQLGAPTIVEQASAERPWRLPFTPPANLVDEEGLPSALWLHTLSQSGVLVEVREQPVPKRFNLWLPVEGQRPLELSGTLARQTGEGLFAYRLNLRKSRSNERLRAFLLERHQHLHRQESAPS